MKHQNFDKNHFRSTFMHTNMRMTLVKRPPGVRIPYPHQIVQDDALGGGDAAW